MSDEEFSVETRADIYMQKAALAHAASDLHFDVDATDVHRQYMHELITAPAASHENMPPQAVNSEFFQWFKNELQQSQTYLDSLIDRHGNRLTDANERTQLLQDAVDMYVDDFDARYGDRQFSLRSEADVAGVGDTRIVIDDLQQQLIDNHYAISESQKLLDLMRDKSERFEGDIEASNNPEEELDAQRAHLEWKMERAAIDEQVPIAEAVPQAISDQNTYPTPDEISKMNPAEREQLGDQLLLDLQGRLDALQTGDASETSSDATAFDAGLEERQRDRDGHDL